MSLKHKLVPLFFVLLLLCSPVVGKGSESLNQFWEGGAPKSFDHVMVFNGIGLDFGIHIGMLDAAIDQGKKPDLIIGTCGGSVTTAIHQAFPDREERLAFLTSPELHQFLLAPYRVAQEEGVEMGKMKYLRIAFQSFLRKWGIRKSVQNYFPHKMAVLPQNAVPSEIDGAMVGADGIRYITLAARTELTPETIKGKRHDGTKYYQETLFTDPETATLLRGYKSPIGILFPESAVEVDTVVRSDQTFGIAIRTGVSDPYVFEPGILDDGRYLTGGINLHPIELARGLGNEVTFAFRNGFSSVFNAITEGGAFMYDTRERQRIVADQYADHWVDFTDRKHWKVGFSLTKGLTSEYSEFREKVLKQYILGYLRTAESYCLPKNQKAHLRNATKREMHQTLRKSLMTDRQNTLTRCAKLPELQTSLEERFGVQLPPIDLIRIYEKKGDITVIRGGEVIYDTAVERQKKKERKKRAQEST